MECFVIFMLAAIIDEHWTLSVLTQVKFISRSHKFPWWQWKEGDNSLWWSIQGHRLMESLPALIHDFQKAVGEKCFRSFGGQVRKLYNHSCPYPVALVLVTAPTPEGLEMWCWARCEPRNGRLGPWWTVLFSSHQVSLCIFRPIPEHTPSPKEKPWNPLCFQLQV